MAAGDGDSSAEPLLEPRLIRFLKDRPRLIDRGVREEILEELEKNVAERRTPDTMAEKAVQSAFDRAGETVAPVTKNRVKDKLEKANEGPLEKL